MIMTQTYVPLREGYGWVPESNERVPGPTHIDFRGGHPPCTATRRCESCTCVKWAGDNMVRFLDDGRTVMMPLPVGSTVIEADGHCWIRTKEEGWVPGIPADSEVWCEHA